ncbi:MAG: CvpA family protein [Clostridia bacterium]
MSILDIGAVLLIAYNSIRGITKGFFLSVFNLISFFVAAFLTAQWYPHLSSFLLKTKVYDWVQNRVYEMVVKSNSSAIETSTNSMTDEAVKGVIDSFSLPPAIKALLMEQEKGALTDILDTEHIFQQLSGGIGEFIINVLSMIVLFCVIKMILTIAAEIINQFMKLPLLSQVNKLAGGIFGIVSGIAIVYIICAFFILLSSIQIFTPLTELINESLIIKGFYNNNILIELIM